MNRVSKLRRRRFLQGFGGAMVGLPFLEALAPRKAEAQTAAVKRFGVFFACNGVNMQKWFPTTPTGELTAASLTGTANEPLIPHLGKLLIPRGVHMSPRGFDRDGGGGDDHGKGMAHKLTAQFADEEDWLALGPSVDHVIAGQVNPAGRAPLNLMAGRRSGYKGLDYISYTGAGEAVAAINNPWNAYADFMNLNSTDPATVAAAMRVAQRRQSVLDLVNEQMGDLKRGPLSGDDKAKLDAHFTAIREIEMTMGATGVACLDPAVQMGAAMYDGMPARTLEMEANYPTVAELQVDIMALALACDFTRVATLQFDRGAAGPTFRWDGLNHEYNHHKLSHGKVRDDCFGDETTDGCDNVAGYENMLYDIDRWHQTKLARLLTRLDSYMEADGKTVLDNSVILYSNELSDGKAHSYMDLPYLLAGSCGGYFKQGMYLMLGEPGNSYENRLAPHNKLLNTIVNAMGIQSDWFGVAQGMGGESMQSGVYDVLLA
jgi:hypothetical protein